MKFYLFVAYVVWLFGAFTIVFVLTSATNNPYIQVLIALSSTVFLATIFYTVTKSYASHFKTCNSKIHTLAKQKTQLRTLDQMKTEFVSIASHQLRNPLTSIRGYTSMLLEGSYGKLPKKVYAAIEKISETAELMAISVEDYLNVTRIEAGNLTYKMVDFNLKDEIIQIVDHKRQESIKKGLLLTFKADLQKSGIVHADIDKIRQILHNLINNAIKYTPKGAVTVFVHDNPKKKKIYVDIVDSGIGMKPDELEDIFDKFERAHNAHETSVTGTGLGLFVARKMAREMKGDVTAYSDGVGHGSTFRLEMSLQM